MGKQLIIHGADFSGNVITYGNYQFSIVDNVDTLSFDENNPTRQITVISSRVATINGIAQPAEYVDIEIIPVTGITYSRSMDLANYRVTFTLTWDGETVISGADLIFKQLYSNTIRDIFVSAGSEQTPEITYSNYQISIEGSNPITIRPNTAATVLVVSSAEKFIDGVSQGEVFYPFDIQEVPGISCSKVGNPNSLFEQMLEISATNSEASPFSIVLSQTGGSSTTLYVNCVALQYRIEIANATLKPGTENKYTIGDGKFTIGTSKTIRITSYSTPDGGINKHYIPFTIKRVELDGTETDVTPNPFAYNQVLGYYDVSLTLPSSTVNGYTDNSNLGRHVEWIITQQGSNKQIVFTAFGTPNWVLGFYDGSEVWIHKGNAASHNYSNTIPNYASFNPMFIAPDDNATYDFSIEAVNYAFRFCLRNKRSGNFGNGSGSAYSIPSVYNYIRDTSWNNKLNTDGGNTDRWAINVAKHVNSSGSGDIPYDLDTNNDLTEEAISAINSNIIITRIPRESVSTSE